MCFWHKFEPPLQYHYLKMPYVLEPSAASAMPTVSYLDASHNPTTLHNANRPVAFTVYDIHLRSDLRYAPHPALLKPPYARSNPLPGNMATRTATADDFVYEIKRLASPKINSPIYGVMAEHIVGFKACNAQLQKVLKQHPAWAKKEAYFDLRPYSISGVKALGPHHLQITPMANIGNLNIGWPCLCTSAVGGGSVLPFARSTATQHRF